MKKNPIIRKIEATTRKETKRDEIVEFLLCLRRFSRASGLS
jgi:hypothetical protein